MTINIVAGILIVLVILAFTGKLLKIILKIGFAVGILSLLAYLFFGYNILTLF